MPLINPYSTVGPTGFDPETGLMTEDNPLSMSVRPVTAGLSLTDPTLSVTSPVAPVPPTSTPPQKPGLGAAAWLVPIVTTLFAKKLGISKLAGFSAGAQGVAGAQKSIDKQNSDAVREGLAQKAQDRADAQAKSLEDQRKAKILTDAFALTETGGPEAAKGYVRQALPGIKDYTDLDTAIEKYVSSKQAMAQAKIAAQNTATEKDRLEKVANANRITRNEASKLATEQGWDPSKITYTTDADGFQTPVFPAGQSPKVAGEISSQAALAGLRSGQAGHLSQMSDRELLNSLQEAQKQLETMFDSTPAEKDAYDAQQNLVNGLLAETQNPARHIGKATSPPPPPPPKPFIGSPSPTPPVTAGLSAGIAPAPAQTQLPVAPPATPPPVVPSATQPALTPLPPDSVARLQTAGIKPDKPQKAPPEQIAGMKFKAAHYEGMSEAKVDALIKTLKANNPLITTDDQALQIILKRLHEKTGK